MFVNREYVDDELIRIEATRLRDQFRVQNPAANELEVGMHAQKLARENLIERTLLRQAAQQDGAPIAPEDIENALRDYYARDARHAQCMLPADHENLRTNIEIGLRIERLTNRVGNVAVRPKAREVKDYYNNNRQFFQTPEQVHVAHIVKNVDETASEGDALAAITSIKAMLSDGAKFEEVADKFSDCPGRGGDLGFFARGEMVQEFEDVVFGLTQGETSDIFRSPFGFHIAKLYERRVARLRTFEEVKADVEQHLWHEKRREAVASYIAGLRVNADIRKTLRSQT